jgi:hypothetical protein
MERVGARLRSRINGRPDLREATSNVPNHLLASALTQPVVASLGIEENDLLLDNFSEAEAAALRWIQSGTEEAVSYLRLWLAARAEAENIAFDMFVPTWEEHMLAASTEWRDSLLQLARQTIYNPLRAPDDFGEADALSVPPDMARKVLLRAGGGPVSPANAPNIGGIATGRTMRDILNSYEVPVKGNIWMYGPSRDRAFQGHLQLDGAVFEGENAEVLRVWPEDSWLRREFYAVGDHWGCCCVVAPYIDVY